jgi:uncharacterized protein YciI
MYNACCTYNNNTEEGKQMHEEKHEEHLRNKYLAGKCR